MTELDTDIPFIVLGTAPRLTFPTITDAARIPDTVNSLPELAAAIRRQLDMATDTPVQAGWTRLYWDLYTLAGGWLSGWQGLADPYGTWHGQFGTLPSLFEHAVTPTYGLQPFPTPRRAAAVHEIPDPSYLLGSTGRLVSTVLDYRLPLLNGWYPDTLGGTRRTDAFLPDDVKTFRDPVQLYLAATHYRAAGWAHRTNRGIKRRVVGWTRVRDAVAPAAVETWRLLTEHWNTWLQQAHETPPLPAGRAVTIPHRKASTWH